MIVHNEPLVELVTCTDWPDILIEYAARNCYDSEMSATQISGRNFIKNIIKKGHTSVLEHASVTFEIKCSRSAMSQLTRHRIASYSIQSQRYVKIDEPEVVLCRDEPEIVVCSKDSFVNDFVLSEAAKTFLKYKYLIDNNTKPEDARQVLPNCTATNVIMTINFRSLLNFFELRLDKHAQYEIRIIAKKMLEIMKEKTCVFDHVREKI